MRLEGKVALITGGESGIGLATARLFASEGAQLHLLGLQEGPLGDAAEELGGLGSVADVTDEEAVQRAVADGVERFGGYDVIFSNAGNSGEIKNVPEYPTDVFQRVLDVHVRGAFLVTKYTIPHVRDAGSIVITSSVAGRVGFPGLSAYCTAKHAQVGLMRVLAKELAPRRVRVNTLHPGPTSTAFQDDIEVRFTGQEVEAARKVFDEMIPLGRHTTPEEIAQAVLYLAADSGAMVNSQQFSIDGGLSAM
jgi:NAD(P)-dependent dehydrogenase (short-subunit alcohol dehydrogenase family)